MRVFCDFDGTISLKDTADEIFSRFAASEWEVVEAEWQSGRIGSAECMQRQIALIDASMPELDAVLDNMEIDPVFPAFARFCEAIGAPLTVISDGVDYFIRRILQRHHLDHLPIIANTLTVAGERSYVLGGLYTSIACAARAGVCKCRPVNLHNGVRIFVGDGRSDFCVAGAADLLFAKNSLAAHCVQRFIPFIPYQNFADVQSVLQGAMPEITGAAPARHVTV
ncbi:MAG: phosphoserine phosphatase [Alphaproteobacteria bacterium]|nr:phosphoserine phosphatase [Alphaproteobacteria bacterium]